MRVHAEKDEMESLFDRLDTESKQNADAGLVSKIEYDDDGNAFSTLKPGVIEKLAPLDHKSIKYIAIKKDFYREDAAVAQRPWSAISEQRRAKRLSL